MDFLQAVFLGVLQGLAEWLPVSSQGQVMAFAMSLFGIAPEQAFQYAVFLHIGTLVSAILFFRKDLVSLVKQKDFELGKFVLFALAGTGLVGLPAYLFLKNFFSSPFLLMILIGIALIFTGLIQFKKQAPKNEVSSKNGFFTGLAQGFSIIPGVSRSGITVSALLVQGFDAEQALRLSFILSIPTVIVAELFFSLFEGFAFEPMVLVAVASAAIVGYASIAVLLKIARRINFGFFCVALGLFYLALAFV